MHVASCLWDRAKNRRLGSIFRIGLNPVDINIDLVRPISESVLKFWASFQWE